MRAKDNRIWKIKYKIPTKYKWGNCDVVPLLPLLGVNHRLPILHMSKTFFYINSAGKLIKNFTIVYMVNPTLNVNRVLREQVEERF